MPANKLSLSWLGVALMQPNPHVCAFPNPRGPRAVYVCPVSGCASPLYAELPSVAARAASSHSPSDDISYPTGHADASSGVHATPT